MSDGTQPAETPDTVHLEAARAVFRGRNAKLGTPEAPTKAGLIALAKKGHLVWNTWRATYPKPIADFSEVDFRHEQVDFSGFTFSSDGRDVEKEERVPCVDFSRASFGDIANFKGANFGDMANFEDTSFGFGAVFMGASFRYRAIFDGASFKNMAIFTGASFGVGASFMYVNFKYQSIFDETSFGIGASFEGARFEGGASFSGANFGYMTSFSGASFEGGASFDGASFEDGADFAALLLKETGEMRSDAFESISFAGASFRGYVSFQNRRFLDATDFGMTEADITMPQPNGTDRLIPIGTPTRFFGVPNFHGCTLHQNTSFDGAEFKAPPSPEVARAYRTLKLAFAQQHALREEQRFFRLEMQAEAGTAKFPRKQLFQLYEVCSDYGFSLKRPIGLWLITLAVLGALYGWQTVSPFTLDNGQQMNWPVILQWMQYTLINAVPLPGSELTLKELREPLFGVFAPSLGLTVLEILHKTISLISLFLVGLALRNLFKMKG